MVNKKDVVNFIYNMEAFRSRIYASSFHAVKALPEGY